MIATFCTAKIVKKLGFHKAFLFNIISTFFVTFAADLIIDIRGQI